MSVLNIFKCIFIAVVVSMSFGMSAQTTADSIQTPVPVVAKTINYPHFYWGFLGGYNMLKVDAERDDVRLNNDPSPTGGVYFELRINKWLGVETGGDYLMFSGDASFSSEEGYRMTLDELTDSEGDIYNATYAATGVKETWEVSYVEIPLAVKLQLMAGKWTFFLKPGLSYNLVVNSSYEQSGNYSRSGYYPAYHVTFENLPSHGFYKQSKQSSGKPAFADFITPFVGVGVVLPAKRGNLFVEARYYPAMLSMVESGNGTLFEGPDNLAPLTNDYQFESITQESGKVTMSGFVFNLGFRF